MSLLLCWTTASIRKVPRNWFPFFWWFPANQTCACSLVRTLAPAFNLRRRRINQRGLALKHSAHACGLFIGLLPALLLNGFAHAGNGFNVIAGLDAGGVDHVLVPGAPRQSG